MSRRRWAGAVAVALAAVLVSGCGGPSGGSGDGSGDGSAAPSSGGSTSSPTASSSATDASGIRRYVAIGDSYTAAPYVYLTDVAGGCFRSNGNYPALLAKRLGATSVRDVSCSGATTGDVTGRQQTPTGGSVAPQIDAVGADTQLVTIGLGGNDGNVFGDLAAGCPLTGPNGGPVQHRTGGACGSVDPVALAPTITAMQRSLAGVVGEVRRRAPRATVVLVGYPRLVQPGRTCPSTLPVTGDRLTAVDRVTRMLDGAVAGAARSSGARYVDVYAASKGHDICAGGQAWVNGVRGDTQRAAPLHPFAAEQAAVARLVQQAVTRR